MGMDAGMRMWAQPYGCERIETTETMIETALDARVENDRALVQPILS